MDENEQPAFSTRLFDGESQQDLDEISQHDFAGNRLCRLDDRRGVQLPGRRAGSRSRKRHRRTLAHLRVTPLEQANLSNRTPLFVVEPGTTQELECSGVETARGVEAAGNLQCNRLIVDIAMGARRRNRLFVKPVCFRVPCLDARKLGSYQVRAGAEVFRTVRCQYRK